MHQHHGILICIGTGVTVLVEYIEKYKKNKSIYTQLLFETTHLPPISKKMIMDTLHVFLYTLQPS